MATLKDYFKSRVNLDDFTDKFNLAVFVETGTGIGETVDFIKYSFDTIYSIEMFPEIFELAQKRFIGCNNVRLICEESKDGLVQVLKQTTSDPHLFFLDAHFPGADFGFADYDEGFEDEIRIPLQRELDIIKAFRGKDVSKDCIIIDDLRIYEKGEYGDGNWEHQEKLGGNGIEFIYGLFSDTHNIEKDFRFQGFVILTPKT